MSKPTFLGPLVGKGVGQCELIYAERGSLLASRVEPAFDSKTRRKGLLGRESIPGDYAMIIAPCSAVHTFGMRTPLDLLFVARDGTIKKTCRGVRPWRMAGSMGAYAVVEAAPGFIDRHDLVPGEVVALRETANASSAGEAQATAAIHAADAAPVVTSNPAVESGAAPARRTTRKRVTLADVLATETPLAWFESVAIVQELCETVLARGPADDLRIPELKHIAVTSDGRVTLLAEGPGGHSPVQRAGLVLLALTPEEQLPLQLRLLVLEEVSPRPRLNSLRDLHRELEFYERPDRQFIVREVYERFLRQSGPGAVVPTVPPPLLEPPPPKRHHRWWRRRSVWGGGLVVLMTLAAASVMWVWPRPEGQRLRSGVEQFSRTSRAAGRKAIQVVGREVDAAKGRFWSRPRQPEPNVLVLADAESPRAPDLGQNIGLEGGGATAPAVPPVQLARTPLGGGAEPLAAAPDPGVVPPASSAGPEPGLVFSSGDARVIPPRPVSPRAAARTSDRAGGNVEPEVELVVSAAGEVESVRLVSGETTALIGMQMSTVKAWRFEPATLDGQPVRYRLRVRLPVS